MRVWIVVAIAVVVCLVGVGYRSLDEENQPLDDHDRQLKSAIALARRVLRTNLRSLDYFETLILPKFSSPLFSITMDTLATGVRTHDIANLLLSFPGVTHTSAVNSHIFHVEYKHPNVTRRLPELVARLSVSFASSVPPPTRELLEWLITDNTFNRRRLLLTTDATEANNSDFDRTIAVNQSMLEMHRKDLEEWRHNHLVELMKWWHPLDYPLTASFHMKFHWQTKSIEIKVEQNRR